MFLQVYIYFTDFYVKIQETWVFNIFDPICEYLLCNNNKLIISTSKIHRSAKDFMVNASLRGYTSYILCYY